MSPCIQYIAICHICGCFCMGGCPPYKKGVLRTSAKWSVIGFAKEDQFYTLDCCISGYDTMRWFYAKRMHDSRWTPYSAEMYDNNNQTIEFRSIKWKSQGFYKCVAVNHTTRNNITSVIKLNTYNCTGRDTPIRRSPHFHDVCINEFPSDIEMDCAADFGECKKKPLISVEVDWYYNDNGTISELADTDLMKSGRLNITNTGLDKKSLYRNAKLVLKNVTKADIGRMFYCSISSPKGVDEMPGIEAEDNPFSVTLVNCQGSPGRKIKPNPSEIIHTAVAITVGCIITVIFVMLLIYTLPRTKLFCRDHVPRLYGNFQGRRYRQIEQRQFHAAVIHTHTARESADLLRNDLVDNHYSVRMISEGAGGHIFEDADNLVGKASTILIIPDGMEEGEWPNLLSSIKDRVENKDTMLVIQFNDAPHIQSLNGLKHLKYVPKTSALRFRYIWKLKLHLPPLQIINADIAIDERELIPENE